MLGKTPAGEVQDRRGRVALHVCHGRRRGGVRLEAAEDDVIIRLALRTLDRT
jgi:hypothetical protein